MNRLIELLLIAILVGFGLLAVFGEPFIRRVHAQDAAIGDSIALGTGRALGVPIYARVGASSCWVLHHAPHVSFRYVVVSAGINDPPGPCVEALFASILAKRIVVILPAPINSAYENVRRLALSHGFATIGYACAGGCSRTNFHPGSYSVLARDVRKLWRGQ